jgi:perosamine synthetase
MPETQHFTDMIPAARPWFPSEDLDEILPAIEGILRSGRLILGEYTDAFEEAFRRYIGTDFAVAVNSCSSAIQIALRFFGVRGREVILPTNNFPGAVSCVLYEGGIPVLADMEPSTFCADTDDVLRRITPRTAGVMIVHLAGLVYPDIDRLRTVCRDKGLFLLEDAAHAHGAAIDGRRAGSLADVGCFSFYPTKIMTTGTGGMITTDNAALAEYARKVRHHGQGKRREDFDQMGSDWCLSEIHAVLGLRQLARVDDNVAHRNQLVAWYREGLADADWLTIPSYSDRFQHAYYKLPTIVAEDVDRDLLRRTLEDDYGIQNGTVYDPPCHLQGAFRDTLGLGRGSYPKAERTLARQLCPPVHATVTRDDVQRVLDAMHEVIGRCRLPRGTPR